jgi:4-hydroxythreonine-4-phosphate dehydrogenase
MNPLVLTPGDPRGIGPEIAVRALAARPEGAHPVVLAGDRRALEAARAGTGLDLDLVRVPDLETAFALAPVGVPVWDPGADGEAVEVAAIRGAVAACLDGRAAGLVTGPIHKARLAERGFAHPGHTDFLGALCGVDHPVMAFVGGRIRVALVTVHLPLRQVAEALTVDRVVHTVRTADHALRTWLGLAAPRLLVCGLNPHAGDGGLLGREEIAIIGPALEALRAEGIDARGPASAEAAFRRALAGEVDLVVAMYHDQGLAPLKLVDFGESVNWTLGLPILRTSVDHGTADDIAGRWRADPRSLQAALRLAEQIAARRASGVRA